jgi:catechol 2,3-dioxygenase-like lactoylglutathione lyase family enzyme
VVAYRVPLEGLNAWMMRLAEHAIDVEGPSERFGERMIALTDPDGLRLELIEAAGSSGADGGADGTPTDDGFHSVTLWLSDPAPTARVLTHLFGYEGGRAGGDRRNGAPALPLAGGRARLRRGPDPLGCPAYRQAGRGARSTTRRVPRRDEGGPARIGASTSPPSASTSCP